MRIKDDPVKKVQLAYQYRVRTWLRTGLLQLVHQIMENDLEPQNLSLMSTLDQNMIANVFFICFRVMKEKAEPASTLCKCNSKPHKNFYDSPSVYTTLTNGVCNACKRPASRPTITNPEVLIDRTFSRNLEECEGDTPWICCSITVKRYMSMLYLNTGIWSIGFGPLVIIVISANSCGEGTFSQFLTSMFTCACGRQHINNRTKLALPCTAGYIYAQRLPS